MSKVSGQSPGPAEDAAAIVARLQKPGAGLPLLQRLLLRFYVKPFVAARADWEKDKADFASVNAKILAACDRLNNVELSRRILVPPQAGLEDSSRYWSAAMTLEHMVIVGSGMRDIIIELSQGRVPPVKPDTAKVKPFGRMTAAESLDSFRAFAAGTMEDIDSRLGDRDSATSLDHPWFGAFTARQWHWLLPVHGVIHLKQLREIAKKLKNA